MKDMDEDILLGQHLGGDPPRQPFRERTLGDSTTALVHTWCWRSIRRKAGFAIAAAVIAGVAFLSGRLSTPPPQRQTEIAWRVPTAAPGGVVVPEELIDWLEAAQLFRQLGMEERMARAVARAGGLLPHEARMADIEEGEGESLRLARDDETGSGETAERSQSLEIFNRVMAQTLGGQNHEDSRD